MSTPRKRKRQSDGATPFKLYGSADQERADLEQQAAESRAWWRDLADMIERGEMPQKTYDRLAIATALRDRADAIQPVHKRPRGAHRALVAVQVEVVMRRDGLSQGDAAGVVADWYGREDPDAIRKAHSELREQSAAYVDAFAHLLGAGPRAQSKP